MKIQGHKDNSILYHCDSCGTHGKCMVRPLGEAALMVVDIKCPNCWNTERVTLLQYSTKEEKERLMENMNEADVCGTLVLSNQIISKGD